MGTMKPTSQLSGLLCESVSVIFVVCLHCWSSLDPHWQLVGPNERDHSDWLFSLMNHCARIQMAAYNFLLGMFSIRSSCKLSVVTNVGVKMVSKLLEDFPF